MEKTKMVPNGQATTSGGQVRPAQQWESFPEPRGWAMRWDERGWVPLKKK